MRDGRVPDATVTRLPRYLRALVEASDAGLSTISSEDLAKASGMNSAKVRKDLSFLGTYGTRGVGYDVAELTAEISQVLGLTADRPVVIVGIGNLGRALANYDGFTRRGFHVAALVDADPTLIGTAIGGHTVRSADELASIIADDGVRIAVIATPAAHAQSVADTVVAAGVSAILNFAPCHLDVPEGVSVRTVDLSTELQILSFYEHLSGGLPAVTG